MALCTAPGSVVWEQPQLVVHGGEDRAPTAGDHRRGFAVQARGGDVPRLPVPGVQQAARDVNAQQLLRLLAPNGALAEEVFGLQRNPPRLR